MIEREQSKLPDPQSIAAQIAAERKTKAQAMLNFPIVYIVDGEVYTDKISNAVGEPSHRDPARSSRGNAQISPQYQPRNLR